MGRIYFHNRPKLPREILLRRRSKNVNPRRLHGDQRSAVRGFRERLEKRPFRALENVAIKVAAETRRIAGSQPGGTGGIFRHLLAE